MKTFSMRRLFLLLILANLLFFAWQYWLRESADPASQIAALQIQPEKIRTLAVETLIPKPSLPAPPKAAASVEACVEWGVFSGPEIARADGALAALGLPAEALQRRVMEIDGYWVHMPVLKTKPEVDRKVAELKGLGISDFYVVQEPANWRNAISLGVFKNEELANTELERLRKQGVRSAVITRRENFFRQVSYFLREQGKPVIARISELQRDFPGAELKAVACPVESQSKNNQ
ncbi:MAG: SPOR domain-containing protein [Betaproteobacteria bacterium]|jgi:hypothetical protein|nr:SPOR domain-containing protein [Betaproteobacteria bacterium]